MRARISRAKDSWPITGATFMLMHMQQMKPKSAREVLNFFDWAYHHGNKLAKQLEYVPMPVQRHQ